MLCSSVIHWQSMCWLVLFFFHLSGLFCGDNFTLGQVPQMLQKDKCLEFAEAGFFYEPHAFPFTQPSVKALEGTSTEGSHPMEIFHIPLMVITLTLAALCQMEIHNRSCALCSRLRYSKGMQPWVAVGQLDKYKCTHTQRETLDFVWLTYLVGSFYGHQVPHKFSKKNPAEVGWLGLTALSTKQAILCHKERL